MSFARFLVILHARFGLIAAVTALVVVTACAVSLAMPARYYAEASAVLEQPALDAAALAAGASGTNYFLATQRDVVGSRNVALRVIDSMGLERDPENSRRLLAGSSPLGALRGWIAGLLQGADADNTSLRDWMVERLLKEITVSTGRDSRLLKVGFNSPDAQFSASVANAFMRAFLDVNVHLKSAPARTERAWLEGQLAELRENLAQAEGKLSAFQQEKGIVATDERVDYENTRLNDLSSQLAIAQSEAYAGEARRRQLQQFAAGKGGSAADIPAEVVTSPVVMRLREDIAQREAALADMSRHIGANHPRRKAAAGELEQLRRQLGSEMRSVAQGLASAGNVSGEREAALRTALEKQKAHLLGMKKDREQLSMLARDVDNAQRAYNSAAQRIAQASIESANERPNASVVDEAAVPTRPAGPRLPLVLAAACVLGASLGLGCALLLESAQRLVRSEEDLVEFLGVRTLAVLPPPRGVRGPMTRALGVNVYSLPKP